MRKNSKGFAQIIIVIILLILIGGAVYYFTKQKINIYPKPSTATVTNTPSTIPTTKPAFVFKSSSKWTTYKVDSYGFSFDYPSDKYVVYFKSGEGDVSPGWNISDRVLDLNKTDDLTHALGLEGIFILPQSTQKSYMDYSLQTGKYQLLSDAVVDGKNAKVLSSKTADGIEHRNYVLDTKFGALVINIISESSYLPFSQKFVSSFKFTN